MYVYSYVGVCVCLFVFSICHTYHILVKLQLHNELHIYINCLNFILFLRHPLRYVTTRYVAVLP